MKNHLLYLCAASLMACASLNTNAAEAATKTDSATKTEPSTKTDDAAPVFYRPWTVGIEAGSTGIGAFGQWRFSDHLGVRAGADYFQYNDGDVEIRGIHYNEKLRLLSEPLTLDVYPWRMHSFHVSLGMMFNQNEATGSANYYNTIVLDGHTFTRASVGSLDMKISQQPVNPYLSIGGNFFYFDHPHHWALGGELGVAYTGDPKVSLTRSGPSSAALDRAVAVTQRGLQDYADQFRWWPIAKIFVTFNF